MSKYICVDYLEPDTEWDEYHDGFTAYSQMAIDTAPSIDICFCRECKWCDDAGKKRALICTNPYIDVDPHPNFFWGYGEREGE